MKFDSYQTRLNNFIDKKINNKSTNKKEKQEIYRNGSYKIEVIIVNDFAEFWVNGTKFWSISPTNDFNFFGNISFENATVTGL